MIRKLRILLAIAVLQGASCQAPAPASETAQPAIALTGRVTDAAGILSDVEERAISSRLAKIERDTARQIVVVTAPSLDGRDIKSFTKALGNAWGIGRTGHNDGVVMLVAPAEKQARIAVGKGLEAQLPDALCQEVMDQAIIPRFREGRWAKGIDDGIDGLVPHLR